VQINFGVIVNEALGDAVKITVIATVPAGTCRYPRDAPPPPSARCP
jgi:hypothetical protein